MTIYQAGPEVLVNTTTVSDQIAPSIATLNNGDYVVVWASNNNDGSNYGIYSQRFNSSGTLLGTETLVNTTTNNGQYEPDVASLADGGFVITWSSQEVAGGITNVYAQKYNSGGVAVGVETLVNTYTSLDQSQSSVTGFDGGGYVVTWTSNGQDGNQGGIYLQRYDANGVALGAETLVNSTTTSSEFQPAVAAFSDGSFVVTWTDSSSQSSKVFMQRFDASGVAIGVETVANTSNVFSYNSHDVTVLTNDDFVVTWWGAAGLFLQQFDAAGSATGPEMNIYGNSNQGQPTIAALSGGGYVAVFRQYNQASSSWDVVAQRFDPTGAKEGPAFFVNTTLAGDQSQITVTGTANDGFVVSWTSADGSGNGIYTRTFTAGGDAPLTVADVASSDENTYLTINVVQNDSDADATALTVVPGSIVVTGFTSSAGLVLPVNGGPVVDNAFLQARFAANGGAINFQAVGLDFLDSGQSITVTMTYDVTDGLSNTTQSTLTFTINGANEILNLNETADFISQGIIDLRFGDSIFGNGGDDVIYAMSGNDLISGGTGDDMLYGGDGNDTVGGGDDDDFVSGGSGNDILRGAAGDDRLEGGSGDDHLTGGTGADQLFGGTGIDTAAYNTSSVGVYIDLGNHETFGGDAEGDTLVGIELVTGSGQNDILKGSAVANTLTGLGGNDFIEGAAGADTLDGGSGVDTLSYDSSNAGVTINLISGVASGGHADGDVFAGFENVTGSAFADLLTGIVSDNVMRGGEGGDTIYGNGGADQLFGENDNDTLFGGNGDDVMIGGQGNDLMNGGSGHDVFLFDMTGFGSDTISGWVDGEDQIDLAGSGLTFASFTVTQVGTATHLVAGGDTIILNATLASSVDVADFVV